MTWQAIRKARQRLGRETGTVYKDWGGRTPVALIYPNSYYLGMSNLGFQTVYGHLNSYDNVVCERVFREQKRVNSETPLSMESQRPLSDFDVVAFSISYELDYFNVVQIIKESGIPLLAADRNDGHPLVIAGGPCVTANPEPLSPFFDCFAIGEGEAILPDLVRTLTQYHESKRDELLKKLASVPGIYVPALYDGIPVKRQWLDDLNSTATTSVILTPDTEFSNMYLIEIARGCGRGCRFCLAGYIFRPFRFRRFDLLVSQAENGLKYGKRIGLLAAAVSDHPGIEKLTVRLRQMDAEVSVSSLRISPLSSAVLRAVAESGTQTVSLAPEAASERLRRLINKCITEDDIIRAIDMIAEQGLRYVKLYFMIGLPAESDDDIEEIILLTLRMRERIKRTGCRIILTVEPFVPKAGTPFQWLAMAEADTLKQRVKRIKSGLSKKGVEVRAESVGWSIVQGVLSRGDARLGSVLSGISENSLAAWRYTLEENRLSADMYVHRELTFDEQLPWSTVDTSVASGYLMEELKRARNGVETPVCPPDDCHVCGVC